MKIPDRMMTAGDGPSAQRPAVRSLGRPPAHAPAGLDRPNAEFRGRAANYHLEETKALKTHSEGPDSWGPRQPAPCPPVSARFSGGRPFGPAASSGSHYSPQRPEDPAHEGPAPQRSLHQLRSRRGQQPGLHQDSGSRHRPDPLVWTSLTAHQGDGGGGASSSTDLANIASGTTTGGRSTA